MRATGIIFLIALIAALVFVAGLFIGGHLPSASSSSNLLVGVNSSSIVNSMKNQMNSMNCSGNSCPMSSITLNLAEVGKHNSASDCWMIINNKVYDVTTYVNSHPGGVGTIVSGCGKDATQLYDTKGGRGAPHSANANSMLDAYYIGDLGQNFSTAQVQNKTSSIESSTSAGSSGSSGRYRNGYDD